MEQLKTYEDACKITGVDPEKLVPDFSGFPEKDRKSMEAHAKLVIVVKAANMLDNDGKEWIPDFDNDDECKYEILFEKTSSGCRFNDHVTWGTLSIVGSRLCFMKWETAKYVAEQFIDLYNEYL